MIKLFVVDLDGTLFDDGKLSQNSCETLVDIQQSGARLMIATGRNITDAAEYVKRLEIKINGGFVAYSDGQYLVDYSDDSYIEFEFLNYSDDVKKIMALTKAPEPIQVFGKNDDYQVFHSRLSRRYIKSLIKTIILRKKNRLLISYKKYQITDIDKVGILLNEGELDTGMLSDKYDIAFVHDKNRYEIKHKGVNKGNAVSIIQKKYGFSDNEVAVFGNDENDISMFERYENSYVVENASEYTKSKANYIVKNRSGKSDVIDEIAKLAKEG